MSGLGKFKVEDFETSEYVFCKLPSQNMETSKSKLRYIICGRVVPEVFSDITTDRMYHIWLSRKAFGEYNRTFLQIIK